MRISQFIEAVNRKDMPSASEFIEKFTHIDRVDVLAARKLLRKNKRLDEKGGKNDC